MSKNHQTVFILFFCFIVYLTYIYMFLQILHPPSPQSHFIQVIVGQTLNHLMRSLHFKF